jgi:rubrerythrin
MNHTEAMDRAEEKTREARHVAKWHRNGVQWTGQQFVQGFAVVAYRCLKCGTVNQAPKQGGNFTEAPCSSCGRTQEQERVW